MKDVCSHIHANPPEAEGGSISLPEEEWLPVSGYEGLYEISNLGRVKSLERTKINHGKLQRVPERILRPGRASTGYYTVALNRDGVSVSHCIHVLVATAFVEGRTDEKCVVNHKDETRHNNVSSNLEWCTQEYNLSYGRAPQNRKQTLLRKGTWNKPPRPVVLMRGGCIVASFESLNEASRQTGIHLSSIWKQCAGRTRRTSDDGWYYAEES
jgi:hypothetical protein